MKRLAAILVDGRTDDRQTPRLEAVDDVGVVVFFIVVVDDVVVVVVVFIIIISAS